MQTKESEHAPQIYWNLAWVGSEPSAVFLVIATTNKIHVFWTWNTEDTQLGSYPIKLEPSFSEFII